MAAFLIAHTTVKDPEKFTAYSAAATETVKPFGGSIVTRGALADVLEGEHDRKSVVVIRFPDQVSLKGWFTSDAYQALIPGRREAADMTLIAYDEPPA